MDNSKEPAIVHHNENKIRIFLLHLVTLPYYWTLRTYTLDPIDRIVQNAVDDRPRLEDLKSFALGKKKELKFVNLASTLSAAASFSVFSWTDVPDTIWLAVALWYCSMFFAIFSLISSAQQSSLLSTLPEIFQPTISISNSSAQLAKTSEDVEASAGAAPIETGLDVALPLKGFHYWNAVYICQYPRMLMAWSWSIFLSALVLHIATPLIGWPVHGAKRKVRRPSHIPNQSLTSPNIAIFSLLTLSLVVVNFAWCSFWAYRVSSNVLKRAADQPPHHRQVIGQVQRMETDKSDATLNEDAVQAMILPA